MKTLTLTTFGILLFSFSLFSQNLPNADLENWSAIQVGEAPDSWETSNMNFQGFFDIERVYQETTDYYHGSTCARIETESQDVFGTPYDVPGILSQAVVGWDVMAGVPTFTGGLATTNRPEFFRGYYKYTPAGSDSCMIHIAVTKWNTGANQQDTIGEGSFKSSAASNWTLFNIPINYTAGISPDSLNVIISSSDDDNMTAGSVLYIDSLSFTGSVPLNVNTAQSNQNSVSLYPNPAIKTLNLNITNADYNNTTIKIYNTIGKIIYTKELIKAKKYYTKLDISDIPRGMYFLEVITDEAKTVKKIIVK